MVFETGAVGGQQFLRPQSYDKINLGLHHTYPFHIGEIISHTPKLSCGVLS
jgi:hypothetical protein